MEVLPVVDGVLLVICVLVAVAVNREGWIRDRWLRAEDRLMVRYRDAYTNI